MHDAINAAARPEFNDFMVIESGVNNFNTFGEVACGQVKDCVYSAYAF